VQTLSKKLKSKNAARAAFFIGVILIKDGAIKTTARPEELVVRRRLDRTHYRIDFLLREHLPVPFRSKDVESEMPISCIEQIQWRPLWNIRIPARLGWFVEVRKSTGAGHSPRFGLLGSEDFSERTLP
jgi:hypothetical protein